MIGRISGTLLEKTPPTLCVDVGGIGYEIDVPMSTLYKLPDIGARVTLHTHLQVRDDAHVLYGFSSTAERGAFRSLIKVTGVGARIALAVLSGMSVEELASAITLQETGRLTRVPGIGKKTAERLLLELRGKLGADIGAASAPVAGGQSDILNALLSLGYSSAETQKALKALPADVDVAEGIRLALKSMAR
ncbi:Holliday junction branch migration protein RuvA [Alcaligenaceae bacterium]|nr:Holliday junction branch migration protein RuvA [Alcaligenaceae bacterium]